jgi:hypothetical protein
MENKEININEYFDKETDPIKWIDLIVFRASVLKDLGEKMPVEWARERMRIFIKNLINNK